jgi:hypothetical protein
VFAASRPVGDPLDFYVVGATVIPVLYLGLIYQARILDQKLFPLSGIPTKRQADRVARWMSVVALLGLVVLLDFLGELAACQALAQGHPSTSREQMVAVAIFNSGLLLAGQNVLAVIAREAKGKLLIRWATLAIAAVGLIGSVAISS